MVFPAKLFAAGAHALSSGKRRATAHKGRPIATFAICFRRLRFHFPVKQCAGHYGRVVTLPDTITGNLRIGNADSLDLALPGSWTKP
jgi:hypothetical protein